MPTKNSDSLVMVFVKNPELGKAKTRLAETVGDEKALEIYIQLLQYTHLIIKDLSCDRAIHYSSFIDENDFWLNELYQKYVQIKGALGEKMQHAFEQAFNQGYEKVVIIGSDCPELTTEIIEEAIDALDKHDVVFGKAEDGGYYLLGMTKLIPELFQDKIWSSSRVLTDSIADCKTLDLSYELLQELSDVDYEKDWLRFKDHLENALEGIKVLKSIRN